MHASSFIHLINGVKKDYTIFTHQVFCLTVRLIQNAHETDFMLLRIGDQRDLVVVEFAVEKKVVPRNKCKQKQQTKHYSTGSLWTCNSKCLFTFQALRLQQM
jgi:hypothetical protein